MVQSRGEDSTAPAQARPSSGRVSLIMWTPRVLATTLMLVVAACSGEPSGTQTPASPSPTVSPDATSRFPELSEDELLAMTRPFSVRGEDDVRLEGRLFGSGEVGVVFAHMGGSGDQSQWLGLAGLLAEQGYRVLTFNRRGSCPGGDLGCSGGRNDGDGWKDLAFLVERLREAGARTVVVGGASLGAMESLYALSRGLDADGLIWVSGVDLYQGVPVTDQVDHVTVPKLFIAGAFDDEPGDLRRVLERTAPRPRQVVTLDTGEHGTDILDYAPPTVADEFREAVLNFLERL
jgi:pimeloyl-ACP methyl ester carboxylesterase